MHFPEKGAYKLVFDFFFFTSTITENRFIWIFAEKKNQHSQTRVLFKSLEERKQRKNSIGKNTKLLIKINYLSIVHSGKIQIVGGDGFYGLLYTSSKLIKNNSQNRMLYFPVHT